MQLDLAVKDLRALALEEDLPRPGRALGRFVDMNSVHPHRDPPALAEAFDLRPLLSGALDVALPAEVEDILPVGIDGGPVQAAGLFEDDLLAAFFPCGPALGIAAGRDFRREADGDRFSLLVLALDEH